MNNTEKAGRKAETPEMFAKRARLLHADQLMPEYMAAMHMDGSVTIPVSGTSMTPFLGHLRDSVTLAPIGQRRIRRGDIVLYQRTSGHMRAYVMHRVIGITKQGFVMCGDAQTKKERGVAPESLMAIAVAARRKGRTISEKSFIWFFFKHIWRVLRPLRPFIFAIFGKGAFAAKGK